MWRKYKYDSYTNVLTIEDYKTGSQHPQTFTDDAWTDSTSTMKRYYYAGATRVAMRTGTSTLNYLLGDHLGSQSITTNSIGVRVAEERYMPWGESRYTYGTTPTTFKFTGQRLESSFGLYFYNARWYDGSLGRFVQPDTIIPEQQGVQAYDRYAYVNNNPVRYTDPTGHKMICEPEESNCNQEAKLEIIRSNQAKNSNIISNEPLETIKNGNLNIIEKILADERTPVASSAINVITTDIAFAASISLPTPLAPYSGPIVVTSYLIGRGASVISLASTAYQYRHSLNGVTNTDVIISFATMIVSAMPIPQLQVANHISLVYTGLRYFGVLSP